MCDNNAIEKITFEMGYWWLVYAVLILLIIGFIGAALYIKKQMNEAKSHVQQPLTDQPPEEAKHVELGNEQEEQEPVNPEAKWQAESQLLPGGPVSDSREIGTSLKPASAGPAPAEVKKDQPFNM